MELAKDLIDILENTDNSSQKLESWNTTVENLVKSSSSSTVPPSTDSASSEQVQSCSKLLHQKFLLALVHDDSSNPPYHDSDHEKQAQMVLSKWNERSSDTAMDPDMMDVLDPILRACKNWLRWYLQLYTPSQKRSTASVSGEDEIAVFRSKPMLELYLVLLDHWTGASHLSQLSRNAVLLLFYGTFQPIPSSDENSASIYSFLVTDCNCLSRLLQQLVATDHVPLCVALVRNMHNLTASYPPAIALLQQLSITVDAAKRSDWVPETKDPLTFLDRSQILLSFALADSPSQDGTTPFPGNEDDLRAELVQEILRTFYVIRVGQTIHTKDDLVDLICQIINLDATSDDDDDDDDRIRQCQMAAVTVLIDAGKEVAQVLQQKNPTIQSLLNLLQRQISETLQNKKVDDAGSTSLIPLLVLLYKFCQSHQGFRESTIQVVFPPQAEPHFRGLVAAEQETSPKARNMSPLDAPEGTLRHGLIQLLTWPHSQTKRFAGELLWILCQGDSQEFVYRVGMGNALPLLSQKGYAQLPANAYS